MTEGTAGELPPGWAWARLGDVCDVIGGITVDAKRSGPHHLELPYLRVANVQRGRLDVRTLRTILVPAGRVDDLLLRAGDILLNEGGDRDKVGRGWVWEDQVAQCVFQNHVFRARVREDAVCPYFLSHYLNEMARSHFLSGAKQTTNLASISLSVVKETPVAVPPRREQTRIVEAINAVFDDVATGEAALARARDGLAQFRASLLHAACTGALSAEWRAQNPTNETGRDLAAEVMDHLAKEVGAPRRKLLAPDTTGLPPLPTGWHWASVDQLTQFRGNGLSRAPDGEEGDREILRISAVRPMAVNQAQRRFYRPLPGEALDGATTRKDDLLFTRYSGSEHFVGVCGRVRFGEAMLYPDKVMCARPPGGFDGLAAFLELALNAGPSRAFIARNIRTTAGQKGIAGAAIRACPVPVPPRAEMAAILQAFDDAAMDDATLPPGDVAATLRQSILHAAFTGRLVPQDPADEPAAALLARLRAAPPPRRRAPAQPRAGVRA